MNTGYKQATIAYKVSNPGGEPLDVNGNLIRISGKKQAIALLVGQENPDPLKYEVDFYFNEDTVITGNSTVTRDAQSCPYGYIRVTPSEISLGSPDVTATFILESSNKWRLINGPSEYVTLDYTAGNAGRYVITATGRGVGQGYFTFQNETTLQNVTIFASVAGYIRISPNTIVLDGVNSTATFVLESTSNWKLVSGPTDTINIKPVTGVAGTYTITAKGVAIGQGYFTFRNEATQQTAHVYIACVNEKPWILQNATWGVLGFWYDNGIWKYNP